MVNDLRMQLLRRRDAEQEVRRELVSRHGRILLPDKSQDPRLVERMQAIDRENTEWLKSVVREHGWPGRSLVGRDGSDAAWLLVQHADHDAPFQRECLDLLTEAVAKGEGDQRNLAYLTDRVMLKERGVQRYGTQFRYGPEGPEPQPLEDPERVDELRATIGLDPLSEYRKRFEEHH